MVPGTDVVQHIIFSAVFQPEILRVSLISKQTSPLSKLSPFALWSSKALWLIVPFPVTSQGMVLDQYPAESSGHDGHSDGEAETAPGEPEAIQNVDDELDSQSQGSHLEVDVMTLSCWVELS